MERRELIKIVSGLVGRLSRRQGDRVERWLLTNGTPAERQPCMIMRAR
jgi:hypothetical protein